MSQVAFDPHNLGVSFHPSASIRANDWAVVRCEAPAGPVQSRAEMLAFLDGLMGRAVTQAFVRDARELILEFGPDATLSFVDPEDGYEAFELEHLGTLLIV